MHQWLRRNPSSTAGEGGSPGCNKGRTFRAEFTWLCTRGRTPTTKARKSYRNPLVLALEWRKAIDSGHYSSQADLARKKGLSRARVTQILNLLRLSPALIEALLSRGDPLPERTITERQLRRMIDLPARKQIELVEAVLNRR